MQPPSLSVIISMVKNMTGCKKSMYMADVIGLAVLSTYLLLQLMQNITIECV